MQKELVGCAELAQYKGVSKTTRNPGQPGYQPARNCLYQLRSGFFHGVNVMMPVNKIICGDNVAKMRAFIPDASIDLVVTSPPYDNLRMYGGHSWDFEGVAKELWRVIKPGGVLVWVVADETINGSETGTSFRQALRFMEIGFNLNDTMIYRCSKPPANTACRYQPCFEYMFILSSGKPSTFTPIMERCLWAGVGTSPTQRDRLGVLSGGSRRTIKDRKPRENIWFYETGNGKTAATSHPAAFPESLARDHILSWSNEGDIVLDPFSGSGTTALMARSTGRQFIGIEINQAYCEIAKSRMRQGMMFCSDDSDDDPRRSGWVGSDGLP